MYNLTRCCITAVLALILANSGLEASGLKVLHAFGVGSQRGGSSLYASLMDVNGNLYGTGIRRRAQLRRCLPPVARHERRLDGVGALQFQRRNSGWRDPA